MSPTALLYASAGMVLFAMGFYPLLRARSWLRRLIGANVMGTGLFLALVAAAYRGPDARPDPVPHALVLTGIVIAVAATALGVQLIRRLPPAGGDDDPQA